MIRLPLKRTILLFIDGKVYLCRCIHVGPDIATCVDCFERVLTPDGVYYIDDGLQGKIRFDRHKIGGYKLVEDSDLEDIFPEDYEENEKLNHEFVKKLAEKQRRNFRIIKNPSFEDEVRLKRGEIIHFKK